MSEVSVSNTDWAILSDLKDALAAATVSGSPVFQAVDLSTSNQRARETRLTHSPMAVVRYVRTAEHWLPDDVLGCVLSAEIILAAKADTESARLAECLRLQNVAMNAIEASPPADAESWGEADGEYRRKLKWGGPVLDTDADEPWGVCVVPLEVGFTVSGHTGR